MLSDLLSFLITGITENINIEYFLSLLFVTELVKMLTYYSPKKRIHIFKFDKKAKFKFKSKYLAFVMGILLAGLTYYFNVDDYTHLDKSIVKSLLITFAITTSFYELIFFVVIEKTKKILMAIVNADIKPVVIDLADGFSSDEDYNSSSDKKKQTDKLQNSDDDDKIIFIDYNHHSDEIIDK